MKFKWSHNIKTVEKKNTRLINIIMTSVCLMALILLSPVGAFAKDAGNDVSSGGSGIMGIVDDIYGLISNDEVTVTDTAGKKTGYDSIRDAWHYCDHNPGCTIRLEKNISLSEELSTGGRTVRTEIAVDLNGYTIDCQKKCRAFNVYKKGTLKVSDSSENKTGTIINGDENNGGAFRTMGVLELDGISIKNCSSDETLTGGGAISAWVIDTTFFSITDPHVTINNCTIEDCKADKGGAINVECDNIPIIPTANDEEETNSPGKASIKIIDSTIKNCRGISCAGAIFIKGELTVDNCIIEDCSAQYKSGGIEVGPASLLKMNNSTIRKCSVDDGSGGGIYIQYGQGGESRVLPGAAEIWGGCITGNIAKKGAGIIFEYGDVYSSLKIGGELQIYDNFDNKNRQSNIEYDVSNSLKFFDEGLYGKAKVGIGTDKGGSKVVLAKASSEDIASVTAEHMISDHCGGKYDDVGIFVLSGDNYVYNGDSRKMELLSVKLTGPGREKVNGEWNEEEKEITFRIPFAKGYNMETYEVEYDCGTTGTIKSQGSFEGVKDHPFKTGTATREDYTSVDDGLVLEHNGGISVWTLHFINVPEPKCRIRMVNGSIKGKTPTSETDRYKEYKLDTGEKVTMTADDPEEGECFDCWGLSNRVSPPYVFNDWNSKSAEIVVPASKGDSNGLIFTAGYTDLATVEVINGNFSDGTHKKTKEPGEHVKVTSDYSADDFDHWEVVSGKLQLTEKQKSSRTLEFNMNVNDPEASEKLYGNIVVKAVEAGLAKPQADLDSGKYTGNQKVKLSCETQGSCIYYSFDGDEFKLYDGKPLELTVAEDRISEDYNLWFYSAIADSQGRISRKSETVKREYTIMNPAPKISHRLQIEQGKTSDGKSQDMILPGTDVTVIADNAPTGKYFLKWEVISGSLVLTDKQASSEEMKFQMPNSDVTIRAVYDGSSVMPFEAAAEHGTLNGERKTAFFQNSLVTASADVAGSMTFSHWEARGIELTEEQKNSQVFDFRMPGNDIELKAVYTSTPMVAYSLEVSQGYLEEDKSKTAGKYMEGREVTVTGQAPDPETENGLAYKFSKWVIVSAPEGFELSEQQKTSEETSILMPAGDVTLAAVYDMEETPELVYVLHGTVNGQNQGRFNEGESLEINSDEAAGATFDHWEAYGISLSTGQKYSESFTTTMPANTVILEAKYAKVPIDPHKLKAVHGSILSKEEEGEENKVGGDEGSFFPGSQIRIKADFAAGMAFDHWKAEGIKLTDDQKKQATITVTMPDNEVTLTAVYRNADIRPYTLAVTGGEIQGSDDPESGVYYPGSNVTVKASAIKGKVFDHWKSEGLEISEELSKNKTLTIMMPENDVKLTAVFRNKEDESGTGTGDNNNNMLPLGLMICAGAAAFAIMMCRRSTARRK